MALPATENPESRKLPTTPLRRRPPFATLHRVWILLFASAFVDPIVAMLAPPLFSVPTARQLSIYFAICAALFLSQETMKRLLTSMRGAHRTALERKSSAIPAGAILLGLLAGAKFFLFPGSIDLGSIVVFIVVAVGFIQAFRQASSQLSKDRELLTTNSLARTIRWEDQIIAISVVPMILARGIGLLGAFSSSHLPDPVLACAPFTFVCLLFLGMLRPKREHFMGHCPKCRQPVPIVFVSIGSCPRCNDRFFAH